MSQINNQEQIKQADKLLAGRSLVINAFVKSIIDVTRELTFKHKYVDYQKFRDGSIDLSTIVFDENDRLIFTPGEQAVMNAVYTVGKFSIPPRAVLLTGTEYGLVVMHGVRDSYAPYKGKIIGDMPVLHTTLALRQATMRHLRRIGAVGKSNAAYASDAEVMEWVSSPTFRAEIEEQVTIDQANGLEIGDGMKLFERKPFAKPAKKQYQKPQHKKPAPKAAPVQAEQAVAA